MKQRTRKLIEMNASLTHMLPPMHLPVLSKIQFIYQQIVQYQRKVIQELIKIFRLRKYNRNDKVEEYRILSVGFQMTELTGTILQIKHFNY